MLMLPIKTNHYEACLVTSLQVTIFYVVYVFNFSRFERNSSDFRLRVCSAVGPWCSSVTSAYDVNIAD